MAEKLAVLAVQGICVVCLSVLVALGRDSAVTDALLAVAGSICGVGVYQFVRK